MQAERGDVDLLVIGCGRDGIYQPTGVRKAVRVAGTYLRVQITSLCIHCVRARHKLDASPFLSLLAV